MKNNPLPTLIVFLLLASIISVFLPACDESTAPKTTTLYDIYRTNVDGTTTKWTTDDVTLDPDAIPVRWLREDGSKIYLSGNVTIIKRNVAVEEPITEEVEGDDGE